MIPGLQMKWIPTAVFLAAGSLVQCGNPLVGTNGKSPVETVVELLEKMEDTLESDKMKEEKAYKSYACWCTKVSGEKALAIQQAKSQLLALSQEMLKLKGKIATLKSEIEELEEQLSKEKELKKEVDDVHTKANKEYMEATTEFMAMQAALESALGTLSKAHESLALAQGGTHAQLHAQSVSAVQAVMASWTSETRIDNKALSMLSEFVSSGSSYAPQSMTILGILKDMYLQTAANLQHACEREADRNRDYEDADDKEEDKSQQLQEAIDEKKKLKAEAEAELADITQTYDDTNAQMEADIKFFDTTDESCRKTKVEYDDRVALRAEELEGVKKAVEVLERRRVSLVDLAGSKHLKATHKQPTGTNTSFLQVESVEHQAASKAYASLRALARRTHSVRLASLAVSIRKAKLSPCTVQCFSPVKDSIDNMISALKQEQAEDITKKDFCIKEYHEDKKQTAELEWKIKNNNLKISKLENKIATSDAEKNAAVAEKIEEEENKQALQEERTKSNNAYIAAVDDNQKAIALLQEAESELSKYYENNNIDMSFGNSRPVLLQQSPTVYREAPTYDKASRKIQAKGIFALMAHIIEDLQKEIADAHEVEAADQVQYEKELSAVDAMIEKLELKINHLNGVISDMGLEKQAEITAKEENERDLQAVKDANIYPGCDWLLSAFDERAEKRTAEINGLIGAKEYLSGKLG